MDRLIDDFQNLTFGIVVAIGLGLAAIYYLTLFDDGSVILSKINATTATLNKKKQGLKQIEAEIANGEQYEKDVNEIGKKPKNYNILLLLFLI